MIYDIHQSMLDAARGKVLPDNVTMTFNLSQEQTERLWGSPDLHRDRQILLAEWDRDPKAQVYTRTFCGRRFQIQMHK